MSAQPVPAFVHLRVHSEYSLADSIVRIKALPAQVRERGMPAVALTDLMNVYGAVKFYRACVEAGIKPLIGADLYVTDNREAAPPGRLIVLCRNNAGYRFLSHVLTRAYMSPRHGVNAVAERDWVRDGAVDVGEVVLVVGADHADLDAGPGVCHRGPVLAPA